MVWALQVNMIFQLVISFLGIKDNIPFAAEQGKIVVVKIRVGMWKELQLENNALE